MAKRIIAGFPDLEKRNALVRYPRNNDITAHFSGKADARMIWGGDATISLLKSMPTKPRCVDLYFADRYSIAILSGEAVQKAESGELGRIIANFYNDIYTMDQNACSSPQIVIWKDDIPEARNRFWRELFQYAKTKYEMPEIAAMDKFTDICNEAVENKDAAGVANYENLIVRVNIEQLTRKQTNYRGKYGLFHEYILKNWDEFFNFLTEKVQTIATYGIDAEGLREKIIVYGAKGVDRIVNIGDTLKIGVKWDGFNIVRQLSRYIALE